jgi:hypothetical protein
MRCRRWAAARWCIFGHWAGSERRTKAFARKDGAGNGSPAHGRVPLPSAAAAMIESATFPSTWEAPEWVGRIVEVFRRHETRIGPCEPDRRLSSEEVLEVLAPDLQAIGFRIELMKFADQYAPRRSMQADDPAGQRYHLDVYHAQWHCCLAIEDGNAWVDPTIDEERVEPLLVSNADTLCLALPGATGPDSPRQQPPGTSYEHARALAQAVYARRRAYLPRRLVLIGY